MKTVKASRFLLSLFFAAAGFGVGAFLYPGPYTYATANGSTARVNRITGVEQYASSKGWVSREQAVRESMSSAFSGMGDAYRPMGSLHQAGGGTE